MGWKIVAILVTIVSVCYKLCQKTPLTPKQDFNTDLGFYIPRNIETPVLYGSSLKIARLLFQTPILSRIITIFVYNKNHWSDMRDFGSGLDVIPSYLPICLATDKEVEQHQNFAGKYNYTDCLTSSKTIETILGKPSSQSASNKFLSIEDIHNAFKTNRITPYDFAKQSLSAVDQFSKLNAFITLNKEDVLNQAQKSTLRFKSGNILSILDGIPIAIKDAVNVKGYNTSFGTSFMSELNGVSGEDALIVSKLRQLGAVIFGKTNMHEIGIDTSGINSHWGTVRNPYSKYLLHDTSGSSSGSAAVVAAGIVPIAVGTDGGGSIRVPASIQGLVGIKATWNRIPMHFSKWWNLASVGFLTNNIRDAAICYLAVSGWSDTAHTKMLTKNPPIHLGQFKNINDLNGLKIGVYWDWFNDAQQEIVTVCANTVKILKTKYNAKIVEIKIPFLNILSNVHTTIMMTNVWESESHYIEMNMPYQDSTMFSILFGGVFDSVDFMSALKIKSWFMEYFKNEIFNEVDVIAVPMNAIVAPKYILESLNSSISNLKQTGKMIRFAQLANVLGFPAFSIPVGYTNIDGNGDTFSDGSVFPIGLQLIADHWNEHLLFRLGNVIKTEVDINLPPNMFTYSGL
eukprot:184308_1